MAVAFCVSLENKFCLRSHKQQGTAAALPFSGKMAVMAHHLHSVHTIFSSSVPTILIPVAALLAIGFAAWLWYRVSSIKVGSGTHGLRTENGREYLLEEEQRGEDEVRFGLRLFTA